MAEAIFDEFGQKYDILLIPSQGGVFEIVADGRLVFSKSETNRHAEYESDVAPSLRTAP